ncbi:MAG: 8-oxoguanine deaminase [Hyphomicrobiaceae bacterium]
MATLLVRNATVLATMDDAGREIAGGGFHAADGVITAVATTADLPATADTVLDLSGHVVVPGLVNTHHHLYQSLTRAVPAGQDALLFGWLKALYPIWARMGPEHFRVSALTGLAEMMLSGCTTSSDHLYLFPNGARLDDEIEAALEIGIRFHAMRGSMSKGASKGGLPPDSLVETEDRILEDSRRVIETFHDATRLAMLRVGLAPCTPFTVSADLMRETAALARSYGVRLHTHTAENGEDVVYCRETFGMTPVEYVESLGWTGADTWHAHCVKLGPVEIGRFAASRTGVAHCPCSNMRLGSGIAPVRAMIDAGVPVGLGVDGSASTDSGHLLNEARQAMLLQRVAGGAAAMTAREALRLATRGGAEVLGRDDAIGRLAPGFAADFAAYDTATIDMAGAEWDPLAALVLCGPQRAAHVGIGGRIVVSEGKLTTIDLPVHLEQHRRLAKTLIEACR